MTKYFLLTILLLSSPKLLAKNEKQIVYVKNMFAHIHRNPSRYSSSVSTIHCGYPLHIMAKDGTFLVNGKWYYTETHRLKGFVFKDHVDFKRGPCFQKKYPHFFDQMSLGVTDYYKFGRLYDLFLVQSSQVEKK